MKTISFDCRFIEFIKVGFKTQTRRLIRNDEPKKFQVNDIVRVCGSDLVIKIIDVKKEKLKSITDEDANNEGFIDLCDGHEDYDGTWVDTTTYAKDLYIDYMVSLYGEDVVNTGYVWVYYFKLERGVYEKNK